MINLSKIKRKTKIIIIIVSVFVIAFIFLIWLFSQGPTYTAEESSYGITFSKKKAEELKLNWKEVYIQTLDDLGVKKIRIPAYWDEVEKNKNDYSWRDLDWQIHEAAKRDAEIILAIGGRLPRWPECHFPEWSYNITEEERQKETLQYIKNTIERYKSNENITAWQIENEPFLSSHFGVCPSLNTDFLDQEIEMARKLDPARPIIVTDSGELSLWFPAAKRADIFGTTMYKRTYSKNLKRYINYPIGPGFFHFKKNIADMFAEPDKWIVIEMQAEPWGPIPYQNMSDQERKKTMDLQKFKEMLKFGRQAGFKEFYLWGVEWWYWEKEKNKNNEMWEEAKKLF